MYSIRRRLLSMSLGKTEYVNTNSTNMLIKNEDKNSWMTNILKHLKPHKKLSL